jgi:hypothetical protein
MERGDWEVAIDRDREDEMGYLARRFDDMRRRQRTYVRSPAGGGAREERVHRRGLARAADADQHPPRLGGPAARGVREVGHAGIRRGRDAIDRRACQSLEKIAVSATRMAQSDGSEGPPRPALCGRRSRLLADALREATAVAPDRQVTLQRSRSEPEGAPTRSSTATSVQHALDALVRNGIRFSRRRLRDRAARPRRRRTSRSRCRDTGIGLSDEARARLLDDTYVPHDSRHHHTATGLEFNVAGMGFGLALVRRVVEAHGGRLLVDGHEGRGSVFTMVFPGARGERRRAQARSPRERTDWRGLLWLAVLPGHRGLARARGSRQMKVRRPAGPGARVVGGGRPRSTGSRSATRTSIPTGCGCSSTHSCRRTSSCTCRPSCTRASATTSSSADGAYALWTPWLDRDLSLEAGKIPWPIGTYARARTRTRTRSWARRSSNSTARASSWDVPALSVDEQVAKAGTGQFANSADHPYLPSWTSAGGTWARCIVGSQRVRSSSRSAWCRARRLALAGPDNTPGATVSRPASAS